VRDCRPCQKHCPAAFPDSIQVSTAAKQNTPASTSARPTIQLTASVWTVCVAKTSPAADAANTDPPRQTNARVKSAVAAACKTAFVTWDGPEANPEMTQSAR